MGWLGEIRVPSFSPFSSPPQMLAARPRPLNSNPVLLMISPSRSSGSLVSQMPCRFSQSPKGRGETPAHLPQEYCLDRCPEA